MVQNKKIEVKGFQVVTFQKNTFDFISLTDIARFKDPERTNYITQISIASNSMPLKVSWLAFKRFNKFI